MKEPTLSEQQVRRAYPELTRCVQCGVLDQQTKRNDFYDDNGDEIYLSVWLHESCEPQWQVPYPFQDQYEPPPKTYPIKQPSHRFLDRMVTRPRPVHDRCFCCEHYERPDHKAHRISLGYNPHKPWPGRLQPGEILFDCNRAP